MNKKIQELLLQIQILKLQIQILLFRQKVTIPNIKEIKGIIIHHEAGQMGFAGVNQYHKDKWGFKSSLGYYIGYTYFISKDGTIKQGRRDNEEGAHTRGYNEGYIGICLQGNFEIENVLEVQYGALRGIIEHKLDEYNLTYKNVHLHKEFANTLCPGKNMIERLDKDKIVC